MFQGVGASMTQSQGRALAMEALPKESSGRAQGFMTTAFHSGVLLGPSVGGLIIDYIHWRAVFFFLIPIGLCAHCADTDQLLERQRAAARRFRWPKGAIDYLGALLLIGATVTLIAASIIASWNRSRRRCASRSSLAFFVVFLGFIYREYTTASPILDLSLFRIRMFTLALWRCCWSASLR